MAARPSVAARAASRRGERAGPSDPPGGGTVVATTARWAEVLEAIHALSPDGRSWCASVVERLRNVLPGAAAIEIEIAEHSAGGWRVEAQSESEPEVSSRLASSMPERRAPLHEYDRPTVSTHREALGTSSRPTPRHGDFADGISIVALPTWRHAVHLTVAFERELVLQARERELLVRLGLHLETGYRLQSRHAHVRCEIDERGRLVHRDARPLDEGGLASHLQRIRGARHRIKRESVKVMDLWPALVGGELSIVPDGPNGYLVIDNPPCPRAVGVLDGQRANILSLLSRGLSIKMAGYALGLSTGAISEQLAAITVEIRRAPWIDLVRIAALLRNDPRSELSAGALNAVAGNVVERLERELVNGGESSGLRGNAIRKIASQVARLSKASEVTRSRSGADVAIPRSDDIEGSMAPRQKQGGTLILAVFVTSAAMLGAKCRGSSTQDATAADASPPAAGGHDAGRLGMNTEHADMYRRAIDQMGRGDFEGAESTYKQLIAIEPDKAPSYFGLAGIFMKQQRYAEAKALYEKALEIEPRSLPALHGLGLCALQSNDNAGAASYFERALAIDPKDGQCLFGAAKAQVNMGHCQDAGRFSDRARKGARAGAPPAAWDELLKSCREGKPPAAPPDAGAAPRPTRAL